MFRSTKGRHDPVSPADSRKYTALTTTQEYFNATVIGNLKRVTKQSTSDHEAYYSTTTEAPASRHASGLPKSIVSIYMASTDHIISGHVDMIKERKR